MENEPHTKTSYKNMLITWKNFKTSSYIYCHYQIL